MEKPFLVVGIDIGVTSAVAIFDLKNNLLNIESRREFSTSEIIKHILDFGNPLIIATDKRKTPSSIAKIASSFNCRLFHPDHDLTSEEKDRIVKMYVKNQDERDAMSSAIFAYRSYVSQFANVDKALASMNLESESDRVKEMILNKKAANISEAIEKIVGKPKEVVQRRVVEENLDWKETAENLKREISQQKKSYEILRMYSRKLEERLKLTEKQKDQLKNDNMRKNEETRKEVIKDKEVQARDILIRQLQFELGKLRNATEAYREKVAKELELREIQNKNSLPVVLIKEFTRESITDAHKEFGIRNSIVWVRSFKQSRAASKLLIYFKPKLVLGNLDKNTEEMLKGAGVYALNIEPDLKKFYASIDEEKLRSAIKESQKKSLLEWLESYRTYRV